MRVSARVFFSMPSRTQNKRKGTLRFHLVTLFREACEPYLTTSILGRAQREKKIKITYHSPRDFVDNRWGKVDERPYGGGPGMVMMALPVVKAARKALARRLSSRAKPRIAIIWFTPEGKLFTNKEADALATYDDLVLVAGRYEGIDERAASLLRTLAPVKKYSLGPYTLTGGELPALVLVDAVTRRLPGVLGKDASVEERRISSHKVYTRPEVIVWEGKKYRVPKVLTTGNHARIDAWRTSR